MVSRQVSRQVFPPDDLKKTIMNREVSLGEVLFAIKGSPLDSMAGLPRHTEHQMLNYEVVKHRATGAFLFKNEK